MSSQDSSRQPSQRTLLVPEKSSRQRPKQQEKEEPMQVAADEAAEDNVFRSKCKLILNFLVILIDDLRVCVRTTILQW